MKKNFLTSVAFALALGLVACGDGESSNGPANNHEDSNISSVESEDDLPSCTESREGIVNFVDGTKEGFVCKDRKWVHYDMIADVEENLPGCTGSREGLSAYLYEEDRELNCVAGSWDVVGEVTSSSSSEKSGSSSSREKDGSSSSVAPNSSSSVIPGTDPGSPSSSSVIQSSSSEGTSIKDGSKYDASANTLTDLRDGHVYKTVTIGTQTWMAENLNYAYTGVKYNYSYNDSSYTSDSTSWCYVYEASNCDKYGRLYTWSAVMDSAAQFNVNAGTKCGYGKTCTPNSPHRGICPEGWHVPTSEEYNTLYTYIGGSTTAGPLLKSTSGWNDYNGKSGNGTDKYGFSVLPAGYRSNNGYFYTEGIFAYLWSASEYDSDYAWYQDFCYNDDFENPFYSRSFKSRGHSLRCLKD